MKPSLLEHWILSERFFFPRTDPPPDEVRFEVTTADGFTLGCAWVPGGERTVLHFHGNGEISADYVPGFSDILAELGVGSCFGEYRGYGDSGGDPTLINMLDDAHAVLDALVEAGVPEETIIPYGRSLGSYAAVELVSTRRVPGAIIESGLADAMERILLRATPEELGTTMEALQADVDARLDQRAKLGRATAPVLVLHAEHDTMVDASHARRNASWAQRGELVLLPEGGHQDIFRANREAYLDALRGFFARLS